MSGESERRERIRKCLEQIKRKHGRITPRLVVDAARDRRHPLHAEFDWNNESAADKYRLDQARSLISYVVVEVVSRTTRFSSVSYVRDPKAPTNSQGYVCLTDADLQRDDAERIVASEIERAQAAVNRARAIAAVLDSRFPGISDDLDAALASLAGIGHRMGRGDEDGEGASASH